MSTITGVAGTNIAAVCTVPSPGAVVRQSDWTTAMQSVENDLATIERALVYSSARVLNSPWPVSDGTVGLFSFNVPAPGFASTPLHEIPNGATVTSVSVKVEPAVHGSLPGNMPQVQFISVTAAGSGTIQTVTDTSASTGVYNAVHDITLTLSPSVTIDRTAKLYLIKFTQEHGSNSADGNIVSASVTIS